MKFAYLIMAHDSLEQLKILLRLLDQPENFIFLHIDKKSGIKKEDCTKVISKADIIVYNMFSVYWGDISQTKCQFFLLREALRHEKFDYFHLLSGHDLPIKSHKDILVFFERNNGKQFIHFESNDFCNKDACKYFHFFEGWLIRHRDSSFYHVIEKMESLSISVQRRIGINRKFYCGANWFSITQQLAKDLCSCEKEILKRVKWTVSSDELVLQTFFRTMTSQNYKLYSDTKCPTDYSGTARAIDWIRGNPYVWKKENYDELMSMDRMFARKFDWSVDNKIITQIADEIFSKD